MRHPVRCEDVLITEAIVKKIEGKRVYFDITQKTITKIHIEKDGKIVQLYEAGEKGYITEKDYSNGYIKKKEIDKGTLYYRERINSPGYAIIELIN